MTAAKTTTARKATPRKAAAAKKTTAPVEPAPAELIHADPADLVVGANVRLDPRLDADFVASIRERGVLEPIVAYREGDGDGDGRLVVLRGQRRTVGALQAGRPTVPVVVIPKPDDVDRVVDQLIENDHRAGLVEAERASAFTQLAAFGLPAGDIVRRTASRRDDVDRALAVARSPRVREATERFPALTFDNLAAFAEFEDDPQALAQLEQAAAKGRGFAHVAQGLRDTRDQRAALVAAEQALRRAGVKVVDQLGSRPKARRLSQLLGAEGELTEQEHMGCPGHAAYVDEDWLYPGDEGYPNPDADPDDDDAAVYAATPVYLCLDWAKHDHKERYPSYSGSRAAIPAAEKTDEQRSAAAAERREVIAGNRAWDSAQTVRRQWLAELLTRKTAPPRAAAFIAGSFARRDHTVSHTLMNGIDLARELLGLQPEGHSYSDYEGYLRRRREMVDLIEQGTDGRALVIGLGLILAAYEQGADRNSWRRTSATDTDGSVSATPRYLRYLESCGYELAPVERRACGEPVELVTTAQ